MTHYSTVANDTFLQIANGQRIIEPRLNDTAHQAIRPGDMIIFKNRQDSQETLTKVVGVLRYPSFKEMLQANPVQRFGAMAERELLWQLLRYYSAEQEIAHGVVGIKLHVLKKESA